MNLSPPKITLGLVLVLLCAGYGAFRLMRKGSPETPLLAAQADGAAGAPASAGPSPATAIESGSSPGPGTASTNASPTATAPSAAVPGSAEAGVVAAPPANPGAMTPAAPGAPAASEPELIPLSFQGANVEMIVEWLAKTTGKSVVKHPRVQCQITIVSSKKLAPRDAITLVYRALALEGFTTVETANTILVVPEGQEPKMSPALMDASSTEIPEGRQRLVKIFPVENLTPAELKERIKGLLSEKGTIEVDERGNRILVTDYTDNIRLMANLIPALDVVSTSAAVIEIFPLKHTDVDEISNLLNLILNERSANSASRPASNPGGGPPGAPPSAGGAAPGASGGGSGGNYQVRLWPDKTANRLIVAAPKAKMAEVKELIETLDTEKPADVGVRVIPLKHVNAGDLVKEVAPLYQKLSGRSAKEMVEVTANGRSNSLIVLSSEANFKAIQHLVATLDTEEAQEKVMQAFPLKNADAEDVAKQLQELSQDQQTSSSRYFYYFSPDDSKKKKMNVVADRRRNTVIVQAPPSSMESIAQMIEALDEPVTDNSLAPKIIPLKFVSAVDIEDVLNELFLKKQQQRSYWYYDDFDQETPNRDVGRLYGKVRITSEPYSNSMIVTSNSPENLAAVEEVIKQLDVPSQAGETTLRIPLKFAQAVTVASSMNILFARGGSPALRPTPQQAGAADPRTQQGQNPAAQNSFELEREAKEDAYFPWLGGQQENYRSSTDRNAMRPVSDLVGRVRVVPDRRSNSLLITSNVHFFPQVLKLINELDAPTAQVLIEAKIIEVSSDFRDKLGVRWSPDGTRTFDEDDLDNSLKIKTDGLYREVFAGSAMAESLRTGVLESSISLDFLVQFLRRNTDSRVLAEPQINIADNEMGKLFVGAQVPFIERSQSTDVGSLNQTFSYKDVGVILEVTPHINNADEVALKIRTESSNIRPGQTLFGGAIIDTRNFRTELMVKNGQTVVLGGIIQREDVNTVRKVPILGDIPGLGWAFKKKDKLSREVELMVFLKPRITRSPQEAQSLLHEIEERSPRLQRLQESQKEMDKKSGKQPAPGKK